ncbi:MAG: hypothetical protein WCT16_03025 [Candidatus Buchananbacteria bacterium]
MKFTRFLELVLENPERTGEILAEFIRSNQERINTLSQAAIIAENIADGLSKETVTPLMGTLNDLLSAIGGVGGTAIKDLNPSIIALIEFALNEFVEVSDSIEDARGRFFNARASMRKAQLFSYINTGCFTRSEAMALVLADMGSGGILSTAGKAAQSANGALKNVGGVVETASRVRKK